MADDLDPLEQHLLAALVALEPPDTAGSAEPFSRGALEGADRESQLRPRGAVAAEGGPQLLHDRLGGPREQCRRRTGPPPDGSRVAPLPLGRLLPRPSRSGWSRRRARHHVRGHRCDRRADRGRAPQGLRPSRARRDPADVHHCISSPPSRRRCDRDRSGPEARRQCTWPSDAIVVCSFGDASLNHATAQAALNTTAHAAHQHLPVPLLFVCEDNGLGISVPSPAGWVGGDAVEPPRSAVRGS